MKNLLGITSSDEPNPNNQNLEEPQDREYPEEYWTMLEKEWDDFIIDVNEDELDDYFKINDNSKTFQV